MNNQQAINLLKGLEQSLDDYCELNDEGKTAFGMAITALELFGNSEQLPPAQPELPDTNVGDPISRQAAIDALDTGLWGVEWDKALATAMLKDLPSAQPERKKGRWIPVDSYSAFGGDEATWIAHGNPVAFYYCSECKEEAYAGEDGEPLLTDYCPNCGADMRGEQDE